MSIFAAVSNGGPDGSAAVAIIFMMIFWFAYIGFFVVLGLTSAIVSVLALVSIYRNRATLRGIELAAWVAISLVITIAGPLCWFLIGRRKMLDDVRAEEQPTPA
ncbi:PLDc N-terminal domain-containing protein [Salinibacterium sp. NK8237]|uniref:PLDc N-terminal domain-containing protein n=1 Tax=Salinibacterium sp. NK8237 TaxID=2792038 RepID=UPI0018CE906C|nr:PLDc N-terminal domain-containing protein [Salinibacterium sp. NK8237]MBH0130888.1 PLDc N-terminal domain-containing protein [Salinibacterium sp. NK8237]